ncbi:MAG: hypothetical protein AAF433_20690 [Bacteroidota bacterium]
MSEHKHLNWPLIIGLPLLVFLTSAGLALSSILRQHPELAIALTYDFALTAPLIYLAMIWRTSIPKTTAVPVFVLGLILASWVLPVHLQGHLAGLKTYLFPVVEVGVLTFVVYSARRAMKTYRKHQSGQLDFYSATKMAAAELLPQRLVAPFAMEIGIIYYGLINWRRRELVANEFSYHRKSGTPAIMGAFIFLILVEVISVHILLAMWSHLAAWILTGLSLYSGLQILGMARSLAKRPIGVEDHILKLPYGIMAEAAIPLDLIDRVELTSSRLDPDNPLASKLSPLGELERHNVVLHLRKSIKITSLYGRKREVELLALHVDEKEGFAAFLEDKKKQLGL